jgi:3-oxoacyl-[acyl-carrier-protein] synthase II
MGRDGMVLGEGAAAIALVRSAETRGARAFGHVLGFGASTDAVHITAPDRTGNGLRRAIEAALQDANLPASRCDLVSAHATSTPYNDAMESKAIHDVFPNDPVVHAFKAQIGHTLGAAGVLETLALLDAIDQAILPASAIASEIDPGARVRMLSESETAAISIGVKQSAAFGGANAALVVGREGAPPSAERSTQLFLATGPRVVSVDLDIIAKHSGVDINQLARMDTLSLLGATAVAHLIDAHGPLSGAGIIVGHALATIDINEQFYRRVLSHGPRGAEPRLFPPTSPNLAGGQIAILFGLTGPSAACCGGLDGGVEALLVASEICAAPCPRIVVVALDTIAEGAEELHATLAGERTLEPGAVACLVTINSTSGARELRRDELRLARPVSGPAGHLGSVAAINEISRK